MQLVRYTFHILHIPLLHKLPFSPAFPLPSIVITIVCHLDKEAFVGSWTFFSPAICCSMSELLEALEDFVTEDAKYPA